MIRIYISNPGALESLQTKAPNLIVTLIQKMNSLMIQLQSRIVGESIPLFFPNGAPNIASTIAAQPSDVRSGSVIHGEVTYGGPRTTKVTLKNGKEVDYAAVQEFGGRAAYTIEPFNKKALRFFSGGKIVFARSVLHPPLQPRPFAHAELQNMESQIVSELQASLIEGLKS